MKIFLDVIGCRLNQSEIEGFANIFRALGHEIVDAPGDADLAIVNTCAVTIKAAADSRKKLRRAGRQGAPRVVATGCWATLYPEEAIELPLVTEVVRNDQKDSLVAEVTGVSNEVISKLNLVRDPLPGDRARTRAFIKVQEGCDNHCTYCLTRLARGRSVSRSLNEIQKDITAATAGEAQEIVLTGVQLGAWGRDLSGEKSLQDLLAGVLALNGYERLRLSSIEPWDFDPGLVRFWKDERMCRHLHIPLQSGHDHLLKAMGRPITTGGYSKLIEHLRSAIPGVAITTDVIAGFPGESDQAFTDSLNYIESVQFAGGHVFTYSPRPGTAAFNMKEQIPKQIAKSRNATLRKVFNTTGSTFRKKFIGKEMPVLWESCEKTAESVWRVSGLTDNYLRVFAESREDLWNQISIVRILAEYPQRSALLGQLLID